MWPRVIKNTAARLGLSPIAASIRRRYRGAATCLMYHRVVAEVAHGDGFAPNQPLLVGLDQFEEQMRYLKSNYRCLSVPDAVELLKTNDLPARAVLVTFDDGYRDNLLALSVLEELNIPATIFITTGFVDGTSFPWWYDLEHVVSQSRELSYQKGGKTFRLRCRTLAEKKRAFQKIVTMMVGLSRQGQSDILRWLRDSCSSGAQFRDLLLNWEEIRTLDRHPLITIGSHSRDHFVLSQLDGRELDVELGGSRRRLEEILGHPVRLLAYPYGAKHAVGPREFEAARIAGYGAAFTTRHANIQPEHRFDLFALPRLAVSCGDTLTSLACKLEGLEGFWRNRAQRVVRE